MNTPSTLRQRWRRLATRSKTPEPQPVRLRQRRVYVLPSSAGLALLATLLSMLLASINYNLSLGYALVFLLGSVFLAHVLIAWRTLVGLELSVQADGESFAGGLAHWRLSIINPQRHERPALRLLDAQNSLLLQTDLPAQGQHTQIIKLPAGRRGRQQIGQLGIESRQPLGWIRAWAYLEPDAQTLIYPAPAGVTKLPQGLTQTPDGHGGTQPGHDDFAGLRSFHPGDSPRHIAWKQLAQGRGLMSKQFSGSVQNECALNWAALPAELDTEARLSQLTQWLISARQQGARCTLILPDGQTGPGSDPAHYQACLQRLALFGLGEAR